MIHSSLSLRTVTYFNRDPTSSLLCSQPIQTPPSGPVLICAAGNCSFGMIPLLRHSVDRSLRVFHFSTHNVVPASCFEVLSVSIESRNLFLAGSLCLAGRWTCSQLSTRGRLLCIADHIRIRPSTHVDVPTLELLQQSHR